MPKSSSSSRRSVASTTRHNCRHLTTTLHTERDRCWWVACKCGAHGPAKNTRTLALIAWAMQLTDLHPRRDNLTRKR